MRFKPQRVNDRVSFIWGSTAAAIRGHALIGNPQPVRRFPILIEHINRNSAARIPISANPEPFWRDFLYQTLPDSGRAGFVKISVIAKAPEEKLEGFALHDPLIRAIIDDQMREIGLTRNRANRRKFRRDKAYHIRFVTRVGDTFELRLIR